MDSQSPILKWTLAVVAVMVACFSLGYFVMGPSARLTGAKEAPAVRAPEERPTPASVARITEKTEQVEAERRRKAEERRRKEEAEAEKKRLEEEKKKAEEAKKKEEEERKKAEAAAAASPSPSPSPTPTPDATPTPKATPEATPTPTPTPNTPEATPTPDKPEATPTPRPTPRATPTPAASRDDKPSDEYHRVRVGGRFARREQAAALASELAGRGFPSTIVTVRRGGKTAYQVQAGAYRDRKLAEDKEKELTSNGYSASIDD